MKIFSKIWEKLEVLGRFLLRALELLISLLILYGVIGVVRIYAPDVMVWLNSMGIEFKVEATLDTGLLAAAVGLSVLLAAARVITKSWWVCALLSTEICAAMGIWAFRQYGLQVDLLGSWGATWKLCGLGGCAALYLIPAVAASWLCAVSSDCEYGDKSPGLSNVAGNFLLALICGPFMVIGMCLLGILSTALLSIVYELAVTFCHPLSGLPSLEVSDLIYFGYLVTVWIYMLTRGWFGKEDSTETSSSYSYSYSGSSYSGYSGYSDSIYTGLSGEPITRDEWNKLNDELDAVQDAIDSGFSDGI